MPNWPKASTTCSASFIRIRPWSTKTQVSFSPTALWTSSAATEESTPPERPQITRPSPTWAWIFSTCSAITDCGDHCSLAAGDVAQEAGEDLGPVGRVDDLGVELDPVEAAVGQLAGGDRRARAGGERGEALRRLEDGVAVAHPAALLLRQAAEQAAAAVAQDQVGAAELARLGRLDPAAERQHHRLHPVTDAQHRNLEIEQLGRERRRPRLVDRGRPAGEDQAPSASARGSSPPRCVAGSSSAKTPHSRIRRAISCEYWPPKSRTRTSSTACPAGGVVAGTSPGCSRGGGSPAATGPAGRAV